MEHFHTYLVFFDELWCICGFSKDWDVSLVTVLVVGKRKRKYQKMSAALVRKIVETSSKAKVLRTLLPVQTKTVDFEMDGILVGLLMIHLIANSFKSELPWADI